jgi:2,3-bisphosphoglycerate-dependent phosphoglycerate mutase
VAELAWLGVVRHGESIANAAADAAEAAGVEVIPIEQRDADVPLSPTGETQARALHGLLPELRPDVVVSSPYRRAVRTAELAVDGALPVRVDDRLRDRELGVLDLLTRHGVAVRFPQEATRRARLGPFYYRPPGGEAWTDVALRLRDVLRDLRADHADRRVLLVAHEAVILLLRYLIEELTEEDLLGFAAARLHNASLTSWVRDGGRLRLATFNDVGHLAQAGVEATRQANV